MPVRQVDVRPGGPLAGLALASAASRALASMVYGVEPMDWTSLTGSVLVLGIVAVAAALFPLWRATRIDPILVLRAE